MAHNRFRLILGALVLCAALLPGLSAATVTGTNTNVTFTCAASTGPYAFTFPAFDLSGIAVIETTAAGVQTVLPSTAYTGTPVNNSYMNGGSLTLGTACPIGDTLTIQRTTEQTQLSAFTEYMPTLYQTFESGLDKLTMEVQDTVPRALKLTGGSPYTNLTVPDPVPGDILQWNTGGTGLQNINPVSYPATFTAINTLSSYTYAGLPPTPTAGTLANLTDNIHGAWYYSAGFWHSITGVANIADYPGALCNGTHNDSAAFTLAIASLAGGGRLRIPNAACKVAPGTLVLGNDMYLEGMGSSTQLISTAASGSFVTVTGDHWGIRDVTLVGYATTGGTGLDLQSANHGRVDMVKVLTFATGINLTNSIDNVFVATRSYLNNLGWSINTASNNNHCFGCGADANTTLGVYIADSINTEYTGNIENNTTGGVEIHHTVGPVTYPRNTSIHNTHFEANGTADIVIGGTYTTPDASAVYTTSLHDNFFGSNSVYASIVVQNGNATMIGSNAYNGSVSIAAVYLRAASVGTQLFGQFSIAGQLSIEAGGTLAQLAPSGTTLFGGAGGEIDFGTAWANVNVTYYSVVLPQPGVYIIYGTLRAHHSGNATVSCKVRLYDTTAGAAIATSDRLLFDWEGTSTSGVIELMVTPMWQVTMTGSGHAIYLQGYSATAQCGLKTGTDGYAEFGYFRLN